MDSERIEAAQDIIGYEFKDQSLLVCALTHASGVEDRMLSNERLEFLGDAVLGFVVCGRVFEAFPDFEEGEMTKIKSAVVSRKVCADIAESMGLGSLLTLGKGMDGRDGLPGSVTGAAYEALIGAIYLDADLERARQFVLETIGEEIEAAAESGHHENYKSVLQQVGQRITGRAPQYVVLDEKGPDHAKCFEVTVDLDGRRFDACWGPSKKQAEQLAALAALVELGHATEAEDGSVEITVD